MPSEAAPRASPPPDPQALRRLGSDDWATLLSFVRPALHDLADPDVTPLVARVRSAPVSRLSAGRVREELVDLLAAGGPAWRALRDRLVDAELPEGLRWLVHPGAEAPAPAPEAVPDGQAGAAAELRRVQADLERARQRTRELVAERDEARRQLTGAEARLDALERRLGETEEELTSARAARAELEAELAAATEERQRAVEREQRRSVGRIDQLEEELRSLRRQEQRRRQAAQRRREREERAPEEAAAPPSLDAPPGPAEVMPGRPSRIPDDLHPRSRAYAEALLTRDRTVLIDGYNVTRTHRPELDLSAQREWLVGQARLLATRRGLDVTVVFDGSDGAPGALRQPREITVVFSAGGLSADDEIDFRVAALPGDLPVVVVTDDRELRARVATLGADLLGTAPLVAVLG